MRAASTIIIGVVNAFYYFLRNNRKFSLRHAVVNAKPHATRDTKFKQAIDEWFENGSSHRVSHRMCIVQRIDGKFIGMRLIPMKLNGSSSNSSCYASSSVLFVMNLHWEFRSLSFVSLPRLCVINKLVHFQLPINKEKPICRVIAVSGKWVAEKTRSTVNTHRTWAWNFNKKNLIVNNYQVGWRVACWMQTQITECCIDQDVIKSNNCRTEIRDG